MDILFIRYLISLIYGSLLTFVFGNISIRENYKKILAVIGVLFAIEAALYGFLGLDIVLNTYPLHTHLLLVLFLVFVYKINFYTGMIYVLLAYMSCQIPAWFSKFTGYFFPDDQVAEVIVYFAFAVVSAILLMLIVDDSAKELLQGGPHTRVIFGLIPITYYIFDYVTTIWTDILYSGNYHITQFLPLVLCIGYPIYIIGYHREQQRSGQALRDKLVIESNMNMIEGEIKNIQEIEKMSRIYRHDMRHNLQLIQSFIQENRLKQAQDFIAENIQAIADVTPERYCEIDIVNLLLAHYANIAKKNQIPYHFDIKLSDKLPISNMEICALISNSLDNACRANMAVPAKLRKLELVFKEHNGMLIFSVDNAYQRVEEEGGANEDIVWDREHGFGTMSIEAVAKKYNGEVSFTGKDGIFSTMVLMQNN